jgi:hypothetical protein
MAGMRWIPLVISGSFCVLLAGCATTAARPPAKSEAATARQPDTAAEKTAALRADDPNAHAEDEARRWGIEENKARKAEKKPAKRVTPVEPAGRANVVGAPGPAAPQPGSPPAP